MIIEGLMEVLQALFGWLFLIIMQLMLRLVDILEKFFDVFAGTRQVYYKGESIYLFDLFFSNNAITNLFWAMAIIGVIVSFGFCIVAVARKVTDVAGTTKHTLGQIMSNFIRSLVVILLLNLTIIVAINATTIVFERINFSMEHADVLDQGMERSYTDEEYATMARVLSVMGNYAANPAAESRYNVNSCFNAVRGELSTLFVSGCFDFDFPVIQTGKHTWQSALAQVAKSANLNEDLQLDTYYPTVQESITLCFEQLKTNSDFKPQKTAVRGNVTSNLSTAKMIFLIASMGAEENEQFANGSFDDALRRSYINGEKNYLSFGDVYDDFAITRINYVVGLIAAFFEIILLGKVILLFIVRMLNLILLYVVSPLFASSMSLDEGSRFQNWIQSFVIQLLAAYGSIIMMRIYLLIVPILLNGELEFFAPGTVPSDFNYLAQLAIVLAGSWAVSRGSSLIAGAISGNAAGAFMDSESAFGRTVSDAVGAGRLHKELSRFRMNRDRAKSYSKGRSESVKQEKQEAGMDEGAQGRNSRQGFDLDKHFQDDSNAENNSGVDRMRQQAGLDGGRDMGAVSADDATASNVESSSLARMRASMGIDPAVNSGGAEDRSNDTFSTESLPDLGRNRANGGSNNTFSTESLPDLGRGSRDARESARKISNQAIQRESAGMRTRNKDE